MNWRSGMCSDYWWLGGLRWLRWWRPESWKNHSCGSWGRWRWWPGGDQRESPWASLELKPLWVCGGDGKLPGTAVRTGGDWAWKNRRASSREKREEVLKWRQTARRAPVQFMPWGTWRWGGVEWTVFWEHCRGWGVGTRDRRESHISPNERRQKRHSGKRWEYRGPCTALNMCSKRAQWKCIPRGDGWVRLVVTIL